jgi:hypothetical protein
LSNVKLVFKNRFQNVRTSVGIYWIQIISNKKI